MCVKRQRIKRDCSHGVLPTLYAATHIGDYWTRHLLALENGFPSKLESGREGGCHNLHPRLGQPVPCPHCRQPIAADSQARRRFARERPCRLVGPPLEARHD